MTTADNSYADCCVLVLLKTNSTLPIPSISETNYKPKITFRVTVFFGAVPAGLNRMFH